MNEKFKILESWLNTAQPGTTLTIATEVFAGWDSDTIDEFNAILDAQRIVKNIKTRADIDGALVVTALEGIRHSMFQGENGDGRVAGAPTGQEENPFRVRYRQLKPVEMEHHDDIKAAAFELHKLIVSIPSIRQMAGQSSDGPIQRDIALAKTALEDCVMRAVRALTG